MRGIDIAFVNPSYNSPKRNKYGAQKAELDGIVFDSKKEMNYYAELLIYQKAGDVVDIKRQVKFELQPGFYHRCKYYKPIEYVADFVVTYRGGRVEVVDVKGYRTDVYKIKKKMLLYKYPNINFLEA